MDGTGALFRDFRQILPTELDVRTISYDEDRHQTYEQLADQVKLQTPIDEPYVVIAESYSGPVASLLAANPVGNLLAVVLVASFVSRPCGHLGSWLATLVPTAMFRFPMPDWALRWLLLDSEASSELISAVKNAIARVRPDVLARRFRDALRADCTLELRRSTARIVYLYSRSDRLLGTRGIRGILTARPNAEIVEVPGPHLLLQCAPASTLAVLRSAGLLP